MTKLFPPFLGQGSKGPAVNMLGFLLKQKKFEDSSRPIDPDGVFTPGGAIAAGVRIVQTRYDLNPTGHLDSKTLAALSDACGFDLSTLTLGMFQGENVVVTADQVTDEALKD